MPIQILPVATSVGAVAAPYGEALRFEEPVAPGSFLVLLGMHRAHVPNPPHPPLVLNDSRGNGYGPAYFMPTPHGQPFVWIGLGRTQRPLLPGDFILALSRTPGSTGPVYPELAGVYRITGADTWVAEGLAAAGGDPTGTPPHNATWSLPQLPAPPEQRERVLVGVLGCGHSAYGGPVVHPGSPYGTPAAREHADGPERWSCLHLLATSYEQEPATYEVSGTFSVTQERWAGAHLALRPVFAGKGNRLDAARGPDGRLVAANGAAVPTAVSRYGDGPEEAPAGGVSALACGASASLRAHPDGRWTLLGCAREPGDFPTGGYTTRLYISRDQARSWEGFVLHAWSRPASENPGYQAAVHVALPRQERLLVLLYAHREQEWRSAAAVSVGGSWHLEEPVPRLAGASPWADAACLRDGRLLVAWLTAGVTRRLYSATSPVPFADEPVAAGRALRLLELPAAVLEDGWTGESGVTLVEAAPPRMEGEEEVVECLDGLRLCLLRDGRLLVLLHRTTWRLGAGGGVTWTAGTLLVAAARGEEGGWQVEPATVPGALATRPDGALLERADGVLEWHLLPTSGAATWRRCRAAARDGTGTWSP